MAALQKSPLPPGGVRLTQMFACEPEQGWVLQRAQVPVFHLLSQEFSCPLFL